MPWVKFLDDFDFRPTPRSMIAYKAGTVVNVTRKCKEEAGDRVEAAQDPTKNDK